MPDTSSTKISRQGSLLRQAGDVELSLDTTLFPGLDTQQAFTESSSDLLKHFRRRVPFEQLSKLVRMAGASNVREFAKRLAFNRDSDIRRQITSSRSSENAFADVAKTAEQALARSQKLAVVQDTAQILPLTRHTVLYHYQVPINNLSPELEGVQILHLSDVHFKQGKTHREHEIEALADHLLEHKITPNLVISTGDVITARAEDFSKRGREGLDRFDASIARCSVLGNHDFYNQAQGEVRAHLKGLGYLDLTDSQLTLNIEGKRLNIIGIDDHLEGVPKPPRMRPGQEDETNIMIVHNLDAVQRSYPKCFDLVLSGHTHAGEVNFGLFNGSDLMHLFGYLDGLNGHVKGWSALTDRALSYISPGHATHFFRFGTYRAGGTLLTLTSAETPAPQ